MPVLHMQDIDLEQEQQQQPHQESRSQRQQQPESSADADRSIEKNHSMVDSRPCCISSVKNAIVTVFFIIVLVALGAFGYIYYFGDADEIPGIGIFRDVDPYSNLDPAYAAKWPTSGTGGLDMTILNALDDKWQTYFQQAVYDWDNGNPDALTLTTQQVSVDSSCSPVDGVIKVCNGDFGDTGWRGINTVALDSNNIITSSVAKMNEYYFQSSGDTQYMQFTMCHEMGHGFGLNHTDENFNNVNLGNCMDYTDRPESNEHPDDTNYKVLAKLYGTVNDSSSAAASAQVSNGNYRRLAKNLRGRRQTPSWVWDKIDEIESNLSCPTCEQQPGARRLHVGKAVETLEYDLGGGYAVRFHLVRHIPNDS